MYDYTDYQGTTLADGAVVVGNVADVRLTGAEMELVWLLTDALRVGFSGGSSMMIYGITIRVLQTLPSARTRT